MASQQQSFLFAALVACIVFDNAWAAECPLNKVMECAEGIDFKNLDGPDLNVEKLCGVLPCIEKLDCDVSSDVKGSFNNPMVLSLCDTSSGCNIMKMKECVGDMSMETISEDPSSEDIEKMCGVHKCLSDMVPACDESMKKKLEPMLMQMKDYCQPGCSSAQLKACENDLKNIPKGLEMIDSEMCKKLTKSVACVKPLAPHCKGEIKADIDLVLSFDSCCDDIVKAKMTCFPAGFPNETEAFDINQCKDKEDAYSCMKGIKLQCTGPIKDQVEKAQTAMATQLKECSKQGYNLTVSVTAGNEGGDGGNMGVTIQSSVAMLFGLVMAVAIFWN